VSKICTRCKGLPQLLQNFHTSKQSKDGYTSWCKKCKNDVNAAYDKANREKTNKKGREWHRKHPEASRRISLKNKYGMTIETYNTMLAAQNGGCAICFRKTPGRKGIKSLIVDHNHKTGQVRGLLCDPCNKGIAYFEENISRMESAKWYLAKYLGVWP
jgi:hypothetical protein